MGNCFPKCFLRKSTSYKSIVLLLVGLDNAGKTSAIKNLKGEPVYSEHPTVGFSSIQIEHKNYLVKIYDLGGSKQIRGIWHRYFSDAHGIIFVIDASDSTRLDEGKETLLTLLSNDKIQQKPILLLANKQDQTGALDEMDLVETLEIEQLVNTFKCKARVETCAAKAINHDHNSCLFNKKPKADPGIYLGFRWLVNCIIDDYNKLNQRVQNDMQRQEYLQKAERQARLKRISELRKLNQNINTENDSEQDNDNTSQDPFKPISTYVENNKDKDELNKRIINVRSISDDKNNSISIESTKNINEPENEINSNSMTDFVADQLKLSASLKRKKFKIKSNKTAPELSDNIFKNAKKDNITSNIELFTISSNELIYSNSNMNTLSTSGVQKEYSTISANFKSTRPISAKSLDIPKTIHNNNSQIQEDTFIKYAQDSGFVSPRGNNTNKNIKENFLTLPNRPKSAGNILFKNSKIQSVLSPGITEHSASSSKAHLPNRESPISLSQYLSRINPTFTFIPD